MNSLFHRLWTKAVGTSDYDKQEWLEFERQLYGDNSDEALRGQQNLPPVGSTVKGCVTPTVDHRQAQEEARLRQEPIAQVRINNKMSPTDKPLDKTVNLDEAIAATRLDTRPTDTQFKASIISRSQPIDSDLRNYVATHAAVGLRIAQWDMPTPRVVQLAYELADAIVEESKK